MSHMGREYRVLKIRCHRGGTLTHVLSMKLEFETSCHLEGLAALISIGIPHLILDFKRWHGNFDSLHCR